MRNLRRSNREEEEEESVFVPMTDMTVSFLFILMILLAFFAVQYSDNPLEDYATEAQKKRVEILRNIESSLKIEFKNQIFVEISAENDALRFKGEGLFGDNGKVLLKDKRPIVQRLAKLTTDAIACYTVNDRGVNYGECNPDGIVIEAVQIEGHTDNREDDEYNMSLSTTRANDAFSTMLRAQTDLLGYRNIRGQPVISVAGYGEMRPVAPNDTPAGRAENRRIDLRIIMYTPRDREQVERIQEGIRDGLRLVVEEAH